MQISSTPAKFNIPFANSAGGGFIRPIPQASQIGVQNGAASLTDGFPPLNFSPVGSGGVPPFGQDFNGLFNQITLWDQWQAAGATTVYDSAFSTAIGGYPRGAILASSVTNNILWLNTVDNNTTNPDSGGSNWVQISPISVSQSGVQNGTWVYAADTGTANAIVAAPTPAVASLVAGMGFRIKLAHSITGSSTIKIGTASAVNLTRADGTATKAGDAVAGEVLYCVYDGTEFQIVNLLSSALPTHNITTYFTAGTYTYTVPAGIYWILVTVTGGGAGAGGTDATNWSGGGGGAGGTAVGWVSVVPGQTVTVTVGAGGGGHSPTTGNGNPGGTSSFGAFMSATGGSGGAGGTSSSGGGTSGTGTGGQINYGGGDGFDGNNTNHNVQGGNGGFSYWGAGGKSSVGTPGTAFQPGAGGGGSWSSPATAGGAGLDGAVVIQF